MADLVLVTRCEHGWGTPHVLEGAGGGDLHNRCTAAKSVVLDPDQVLTTRPFGVDHQVYITVAEILVALEDDA